MVHVQRHILRPLVRGAFVSTPHQRDLRALVACGAAAKSLLSTTCLEKLGPQGKRVHVAILHNQLKLRVNVMLLYIQGSSPQLHTSGILISTRGKISNEIMALTSCPNILPAAISTGWSSHGLPSGRVLHGRVCGMLPVPGRLAVLPRYESS